MHQGKKGRSVLRHYNGFQGVRLAGSVVAGRELVLVDFAAQRVAVYAENLRGTRLVAVGAVQDALDETLLKFSDGLVEQNAPVHHLNDKPLELIFHDRTLRRIWSSLFWAGLPLFAKLVPGQDAIRLPVFGTRGRDNFRRKFRAGRGFGPPDPLEIVAHKLFVERGLRTAGLVLRGGPEAGGVGSERFVDPYQGTDRIGGAESAVEQAELELGVSEDDSAGLGICGRSTIDIDADCADAFSKFYTDERRGLLERNIFVVPGGGFGGGSENGLGQMIRFAQAGWERNAADFAGGLVVLPAGAGNVAAHDAFDGKRLRF